jgi:hypothetical protein
MFLKKAPLHSFFFAIYPILQLLAFNIMETRLSDVYRSLLVSLGIALILILVLQLVLRSWQRAGLISTCILLFFYSYGQIYDYFRQEQLLGSTFRHRYYFPLFLIIMGSVIWFLVRKIKNPLPINQILNLISALMLIFPIQQIATRADFTHEQENRRLKIASLGQSLQPDLSKPLPDVYVFLVDTYLREDYLLTDFGYDNSKFLDQLRSLGFYIAECSRGNYNGTRGAVTTLLNSEYISTLVGNLAALGYNPDKTLWTLIPNSIVRSKLELLGYKIIAFDNPDFPWLLLSDADVFYSNPRPLSTTTFEDLLLQTTAVRSFRSLVELVDPTGRTFPKKTPSPYQRRFQNDMDTFQWLRDAIKINGPKFLYVHLLPLHAPFTHAEDCSLLMDPNYYSLENYKPINEAYFNKGYLSSLKCTNDQIVQIISLILEGSETPPVIVIMGDHGFEGKTNATSILNAYYLPDNGSGKLYPTISPVNSFRLIFNRYFGTHYPLLQDNTYPNGDEQNPIPDPSPACIEAGRD